MSDGLTGPEWIARAAAPLMAHQLGCDLDSITDYVAGPDGEWSETMTDCARWLLEHHGIGYGGYAGSFGRKLVELADHCDSANLVRLSRGWPEMAVVVLMAKQVGTSPVRAIAAGSDYWATDGPDPVPATDGETSSSPADTPSDEDQVTGGD